jgi:hypothetical protein
MPLSSTRITAHLPLLSDPPHHIFLRDLNSLLPSSCPGFSSSFLLEKPGARARWKVETDSVRLINCISLLTPPLASAHPNYDQSRDHTLFFCIIRSLHLSNSKMASRPLMRGIRPPKVYPKGRTSPYAVALTALLLASAFLLVLIALGVLSLPINTPPASPKHERPPRRARSAVESR